MTEFPNITIRSREVALVDYAVMHYQIDEAASALHETSRTLALEISAGGITATENEKICEVLLDISVGRAEFPDIKGYPLSMQIKGVFKASSKLSDKTLLTDVSDNGLQELYAIAKASLVALTASSSAGRIMLPSVLMNRE